MPPFKYYLIFPFVFNQSYWLCFSFIYLVFFSFSSNAFFFFNTVIMKLQTYGFHRFSFSVLLLFQDSNLSPPLHVVVPVPQCPLICDSLLILTDFQDLGNFEALWTGFLLNVLKQGSDCCFSHVRLVLWNFRKNITEGSAVLLESHQGEMMSLEHHW